MNDGSAKPASDMAGFFRAEYDINGVKTVIHTIGSGPELVFLHGAGTFTGFEFARALAARRKVIIPYSPNFGESGDDPTLDSVEDYVLHYMDLFDRLGLTKFDLGGISLGGWLAAEFAVRAPQRLRRLVLVAPAGLVVEKAHAPELSDITPPRHCVISRRHRIRHSMPVSDGRSARSPSSSATIRKAIRSSRAGCTGSPFRRCSFGAARTVCGRPRKPTLGWHCFPTDT
jgi:pimeloyl-ACP methyl ester carboxylesterase